MLLGMGGLEKRYMECAAGSRATWWLYGRMEIDGETRRENVCGQESGGLGLDGAATTAYDRVKAAER